jgi:hypothetical protein
MNKQAALMSYDSARMITMECIRPMYFDAQRMEAGTRFEARADLVPFLEASSRCKIAADTDRPLVYRRLAVG